jgi:hypothetical protein
MRLHVTMEDMFRRIVAVFLVLSWLVLSGIDLLEDYDLPFTIEFEGSTKIPGPAGKTAGSTHDMAEFAHSTRVARAVLSQSPILRFTGEFSTDFGKIAKLHKYYQVFLI